MMSMTNDIENAARALRTQVLATVLVAVLMLPRRRRTRRCSRSRTAIRASTCAGTATTTTPHDRRRAAAAARVPALPDGAEPRQVGGGPRHLAGDHQQPGTGPHTEKAAFWADANIHGNEIQGTEVNLYLIWFLMENYDALPKVKELVDHARSTSCRP
jgi:hypothetical protein